MATTNFLVLGKGPDGPVRVVINAETEQEAKDQYLIANPGYMIFRVLGPQEA